MATRSATAEQLERVRARLIGLDEPGRRAVMGRLRIGLQWDTEVTLDNGGRTVTQAYCSALPIAYGSHRAERWEPFARLVLDGAYEACLTAAALNARLTGNHTAYLTLLGGGAFRNPTRWILDAIERAVGVLRGTDPNPDVDLDPDVDLAFVSYGSPNPALGRLLATMG